MFIQPNKTAGDFDILVPKGQYISIGNTGNEPSVVQIQAATPGQPWLYTTLATLFNSAQTFGPYDQDRTIRIQNRDATVEYDVGTQPKLRGFPALVLGNLTPISLVEPAATFVTLTYGDDAGNVKLVSAGVHDLTNAVAQGASIYVTWTGGTGVTGFYEVVDADTATDEVTIDLPYVLGLGTPVVAVANTAVTLASITVPGWSMGVGGGMEIDALYSLTNSASAKNIGMTYGGGVLMAVSAASNASACAKKLMCNRGSSQIISNAANQVGHGLSTGANVTLSVDATQDQTFAFTAQPAVANNVVTLEAYKLYVTF